MSRDSLSHVILKTNCRTLQVALSVTAVTPSESFQNRFRITKAFRSLKSRQKSEVSNLQSLLNCLARLQSIRPGLRSSLPAAPS